MGKGKVNISSIKNECTGCGACFNICGRNAIYMEDIPEEDMLTIEQNLYRVLDRLGLQELYQTETAPE